VYTLGGMHRRRLAPIALAGALVLSPALTACGGDSAAPTAPASQPAAPVKVDVPTWMAAAQSPGTTIIDVRSPDEYSTGHVEGALLISVESPDFQQQIAALDPSGTYALYCRSGNRSAKAAAIMAEMGYLHVYDLTGGFADLDAAGMPSA
jgi:phage shock protein E